jgi:hypothetical protein
MSEAVRLQDPAETLDHTLDWSDWLATGDTIQASTWAISPTGPDISSTPDAFTTTTATVWLAGVAFGQLYTLANKVTTAAGRIGERSITVRGFVE